jgi:DNA polymerase iota
MEQDEEIEDSIDVEHKNVIIHLDIDYFYAQVEEILDPKLKNLPFGVKQGLNIVTCNYIARERGVGKWRPLKESLEKCADLVVVNGEDLTNYKLYSKKITDLLQSMFKESERIGLDEHYIDITKDIKSQLDVLGNSIEDQHFMGPIYPDEETFSSCKCGCKNNLILGSMIAKQIRDKINDELKLTCSIGIAHNKLLAKLVGQVNKPNNQTVLAPTAAKSFMTDLKSLRSIPGIGEKTQQRLEELGIKSIVELQNCQLSLLKNIFGSEMARRLKEWSIGIDLSEVKPSGKPKTIGLENSFRPISIRSDAAEKFQSLLSRLMIQIQDDGRMPQCIKVTVRKYDPVKKNSIRETKQFALAASNFRYVEGKIQLTKGADEKIMEIILMLFDRMVDLKQQFNITLLGLCFSKFQEHKKGSSSIASFLMKKQDVEVQSITNLSNDSITNSSFNDSYSFRSKTASPSSSLMDFETLSNNSLDLSGSEESELEPSPKKRKKINLLLVAKSRRYSHNEDIASPSKLNVSDLHLSGNSMDTSDGSCSTKNRVISPLCIKAVDEAGCSSVLRQHEMPPNVDPTVLI